MNNQRYVVLSLKLNLFFARIMKEHSLFIEAGFTPKSSKLAKEADGYKRKFEDILLDTVKLSQGIIGQDILDSGEFFTDYTLSTERKTEYFTGIKINQKITMIELELHSIKHKQIKPETIKNVKQINKKAKKLVDELIDLKMRVLDEMLNCKLFTTNYPLLIKHILREAELYRDYLIDLENGEDIECFNNKDIKETELFWDQIMMEHALFIRGLLDPSEDKLIDTSDKFANEYSALIEKAKTMTNETLESITKETLNETIKIRNFKQAGTKGVQECKIKAIFLPLLADHVLREANHYIRILENYKMNK